MLEIEGGLNKSQYRTLKQTIKNLELPKDKQKKILIRLAKHGVIPASKRNAKNQVDPYGKPWATKKQGRKKKTLPKINKFLKIAMKGDIVKIYAQGGKYKSKGKSTIDAGLIGAIHQEGTKIKRTANQEKSERDNDQPSMANKRQAKKLRALGWTTKRGKKEITPSSGWIQSNVTFKSAGLIINRLKNKKYRDAWEIEVPKRVFLGISDEDFNKALERQIQAINYGIQPK